MFVDSPCSGLGTLRRHPEIKWRLTQKRISELAATSYKILTNAANYVSPGGVLAYSTCTVTRAENEEVCERFMNSHAGSNFTLQKFINEDQEYAYFRTQTFSGLNDCHFCAIFRRKLDVK